MAGKLQPLGSIPAASEVRDLKRKAAEKPNLAMAASCVFAGLLVVIVLFIALMGGWGAARWTPRKICAQKRCWRTHATFSKPTVPKRNGPHRLTLPMTTDSWGLRLDICKGPKKNFWQQEVSKASIKVETDAHCHEIAQ
jgi:hypothetical protein